MKKQGQCCGSGGYQLDDFDPAVSASACLAWMCRQSSKQFRRAGQASMQRASSRLHTPSNRIAALILQRCTLGQELTASRMPLCVSMGLCTASQREALAQWRAEERR